MFSIRWPLNRKLAGYFALVGILPLVIALLIGYRSSSTVLRASVGATLREVAILTADKLNRSSHHRRTTLDSALARAGRGEVFGPEEMDLLENDLRTSAPWVVRVVLRDGDGRPLGSFGRSGAEDDTDVLRAGVSWDTGIGHMVTVDWIPIGEAGGLEVMSSGMDVVEILQESAIPGRKIWLVDDRGIVVAGAGPARSGQVADPGMISLLKSRDMGWATVTGEGTVEGRPRLVGFAPVMGSGHDRNQAILGVVVERNLAAATGSSMQLFTRLTSLTLLLTFALLVVSGFFWAERIVKPIRKLQKAFQAVGSGELGMRLELNSGDELEDLAHGYNEMAERLKEYRGRMQQRIERGEEEIESKQRELVTSEEERDLSAAELGLLYAVSRSVLRSTDLGETLQIVADSARTVMGAETVVVYRCDGSGLRLEAVGPMDAAGNLESPGVDSPASIAVAEVRPVVRSGDESSSGAADVFIPMLVGDQVIGAIGFQAEPGRREWRAQDLGRARNIAAQASVAINNARLHADLAERVENLTALYQLGQIVVAELDLARLLDQVLEILEIRFSYRQSAILLLDEEAPPVLRCAASRGFPPESVEGVAIPATEGITGEVVRTGEVVYVSDVSRDDRFVYGIRNARSAMAVPVKRGDRVIGVIDVESPELDAFGERDRRVLTLFAPILAVAMENARAHGVLQASEGRFRALYEVGQALVSTLDPETLMRQALEILETTLGYETTAILLKDAERGDLYVQASRGHDPEVVQDVRVALGSGVCGRVAEVREPIYVDDLSTIDAIQPFGLPDARSALAVPIVHGGDLLGVLDVESRRPAAYDEEDRDVLKLFAAQVAAAVKNARLFREREQALEASQEAERLKTEFLANTSHELRTPLTSIIGFSEVLVDGIPGPLNEKQDQCVQDILGSGRHLLELINQILDLSRIESGRMEPSPDVVDLAGLLEEVAGTVSGLSSRKGLVLDWTVEPGLESVVADRGMVKQVLVNLAGNALKFTPPGGRIDVVARMMSDEDRNRARDGRFSRGRWVELSVTDTGVGISAEDQAVIFKEFRQVDGSFTREHQGSGLGLTLSKRFVELNRGMIWVKSTPGEGASFRFLLPIDYVGNLPDAAEQVLDYRRTVLLVEDDLNSLKLLRRHLEQTGYDVLSATSGEKALSLARRHRPRVIALDIMLPDMDGWSIMTHLRSFSETESIPVIITSVLDNPELGKGLGAVDYFTKPVDRPRFLERIASLGEWRPSRLLLVTVDSDLRTRLQGLLDRPGWRLRMAVEASAVGTVVAEERPDVVLLDMDLPGGKAIELMREIDGLGRDIRIVAIASQVVPVADRKRFPSTVETLVEKLPGMEERVVSVLARLDDLRYGAVGGTK